MASKCRGCDKWFASKKVGEHVLSSDGCQRAYGPQVIEYLRENKKLPRGGVFPKSGYKKMSAPPAEKSVDVETGCQFCPNCGTNIHLVNKALSLARRLSAKIGSK